VFCSLIVAYQISGSTTGYAKFFIVLRGLLPLISHFQMFAAGIIFYLIRKDGWNFLRMVILTVSLVMVIVTHNIGGRVFYYLNTFEHFICSLGFFILFILIISQKAKLLTYKALVLAGEISFALYVIHQSFGIAVYEYLSEYGHQLVAKSVGIILSLAAAYLITYYYDVPVRRFLKRVFSK
jgi:peptidoglycan/LPS O-acetylase OafA/YrhL